MANDIVIRAERLGKRYLIGHQSERERYVALRDVVARAAKNALRKVSGLVRAHSPLPRSSIEEFWALKDINFEVKRGEVLGIIGHNGAGKSTLLKILSRITEPSEGRVTIRGRVASLLEVGTGFHPELTGRENIFLNGAILGMRRAEIKKKFDEIVTFAGIERFLDTPVKRYSSGMYVRLAFAVAAHLEPEILVVDEVLAVGDAEFQKRCLGKIGEVARSGRTILFVSHNLNAIADLSARTLLLQRGKLSHIGPTSKIIETYIGQSSTNQIGKSVASKIAGAEMVFTLTTNAHDGSSGLGKPLRLQLECVSPKVVPLSEFCLIVENIKGHRVGIVDLRMSEPRPVLSLGSQNYVARIDNADLVPGPYLIKLWLSGTEIATELELGTIEIFENSRERGLSLFPAFVNGILNFRGEVQRLAP